MWYIYNHFSTFIVILPVIWGLINLKFIKDAKFILALLIISLLVECSSEISAIFSNYRIYRIGLIYSIFEVIILNYFFLQSIGFKYKWFVLSTSIAMSIYLLIIYIFNIGGMDIPYAITSVYELILVSFYILNNTKSILNNWRFTIFFAFFQYNILAIGIFTMVDYIEKHQEFLVYYLILHSSANLLLYVFISIGLIQCKKHFLKASL